MRIVSAGEYLEISSHHAWIGQVLEEGAGGQLSSEAESDVTVQIEVESSPQPFDTSGWEVLTRDSWRHQEQVMIANACSSGLDLLMKPVGQHLEVIARWRPNLKVRGAAALLRSRAHLLIRSVLLHFPALWWSQQRGRAPLHASVCTVGQAGPTVLIAGPGGIGKSTLIQTQLARGGRSTSDNLCVSDGFTAWGVLEPRRIPSTLNGSAGGRRMPYGRKEAEWSNRVDYLSPDLLLVLRRDGSTATGAKPCDPRDAARFLTAGTYMAGELRRYWSFCATISLGMGLGEIHPAIERVSQAISSRIPCVDLVLGTGPDVDLEDIVTKTLAEVR